MAKLTSGILGPVSGKIGGIVGANWKGTRYARAYVVPGASNTAAQLAQRARFAEVIIPAKYFVTRIFNPYYDKFLSKVSGFNRYVSENIPKAPAYTAIPNHRVTSGPLFPGSGLVTTYSTATGAVSLVWDPALGIDGTADDVAIAWARHRPTGVVYFAANEQRSTGMSAITAPAGLTATDFDCGVFFAQMSGTLVSKISSNLSDTAAAA